MAYPIFCVIYFSFMFFSPLWIRQIVMTLVKQEYETDAKYIVLKSKQSDSNIMTYMDHIISVFQPDNFSLYTGSVSLLNLLQAALAIISGPWIQIHFWRLALKYIMQENAMTTNNVWEHRRSGYKQLQQ